MPSLTESLVGLVQPEATFRFRVKVDGLYFAAFTEFQMPDLQMETQDLKEGGQNTFIHKLPVRMKVGPAILRQGITVDLALMQWYMMVVNGDIQNAIKPVTVDLMNTKGEPWITFHFADAYPIKWKGPKLNTADNSVAVEELHFVHHGFTMESEFIELTSTSG